MADRRHPWQLRLASVLMMLEGVAALVLAVWLLIELFVAKAESPVSAIALIVICLGAGLWIFSAGRSLLRGRGWARSAGVFVQLVLAAFAAGSLGGEGSSVRAFAFLLAPAIVTVILLFTKPVVQASQQRSER